jgi:hypothetical protein
MLHLGLHQELRLELRIEGVACETIFPLVEIWLNNSSKHMEVLKKVAARKDMERYRSVIDFIFCELFRGWRKHAVAYYEDRGPLLKEMITEAERAYYERYMLLFLEVAWQAVQQDWQVCWAKMARVTKELA